MLWKEQFSLGIVHPQIFPETGKGEEAVLETLLVLVSGGFFDAVEITAIKDPAVRSKAKDLLKEFGIRTVFCCAPPILMKKLNLNSLQPEERLEHLRIVKEYLDEAIFMDAEIFTVLSGPDPGPEKRPEALQVLIASLQELCEYAAKRSKSLTVTLETFDREVDKKCLIGPTSEAVQVAREVIGAGYSNFGLTLDQGHLPLLEEEPRSAICEALPYLFHIHLGNCIKSDLSHPLYGDHHPRYGLAGCHLSSADLVAFLEVLSECGFWRDRKAKGQKPVLSFEVKPAPDENSLDTLQETKETWLQAWEVAGKK